MRPVQGVGLRDAFKVMICADFTAIVNQYELLLCGLSSCSGVTSATQAVGSFSHWQAGRAALRQAPSCIAATGHRLLPCLFSTHLVFSRDCHVKGGHAALKLARLPAQVRGM